MVINFIYFYCLNVLYLLNLTILCLSFCIEIFQMLSQGKNLHKMPNMIKCTIPNIYNNFFFNRITSLIGVIKSKGQMEFVKFDMQTLPKRSLILDYICTLFCILNKENSDQSLVIFRLLSNHGIRMITLSFFKNANKKCEHYLRNLF